MLSKHVDLQIIEPGLQTFLLPFLTQFSSPILRDNETDSQVGRNCFRGLHDLECIHGH